MLLLASDLLKSSNLLVDLTEHFAYVSISICIFLINSICASTCQFPPNKSCLPNFPFHTTPEYVTQFQDCSDSYKLFLKHTYLFTSAFFRFFLTFLVSDKIVYPVDKRNVITVTMRINVGEVTA